MSILDKSYDDYKGTDSSGEMYPKVLDCTISEPEIKKTKDGSGEYISLDLAYKDDSDEWRYIRFNNFNPEKSASGAQMWKNLLVVAGAKNGNALKGKKVKAVVSPEEYTKQDGSTGKSYKVYKMGYFSESGKSAGETESGEDKGKMWALLQEACEAYDAQPTPSTEASPETEQDMPFGVIASRLF